ncbi:MAG: PLP-dependent transferase [Clostridia bacterium]|nr:PLP-dependent transferase [Clostridia bacterium]
MSKYRIGTKCLHSGYTPKNGEPRVMPIVQSTTYTYDSVSEMGDLFDLKTDGFFYTRLANPTLDLVEKKIAELEGGVGAMITASGQAASLISITNICLAGDHVICSSSVYGGTFNLFNKTLRDLGIDFTFLPPDATAQDIENAFKENTRAVFIETLANPSLVVTDIELYANIAHKHSVALIVDNTFATPINCRPFEFGADIVVHSTSKYLDGHAAALGGAIVDSGNFVWTKEKYPNLTTPDETYHGVIYTEHFGKAAYIAKARVHLMRDMGAQQSPMNAFILNLGMETLELRMKRHCENALKVAEFLKSSDKIKTVVYPGLEGDKYYELAQKYLPNGTCGVISFVPKGGFDAAVKFMEKLKLTSLAVHVADVRTCALHPASTTHRQLSEKQLEESGIDPAMIRLSVGIENIDDILDDIRNALEN